MCMPIRMRNQIALVLGLAWIPACRGVTGESERIALPAVVASSVAVAPTRSSVVESCREDNPVGVRVVRLAHSELLNHLATVLGDEVVRGQGAPVFYLQGDHTHFAEQRLINSVDFASFRSATQKLAQRYVAALPADAPCLVADKRTACAHGPLSDLLMRLFSTRAGADEVTQLLQAHARWSLQHGARAGLEAVLSAALLSPRVLYRTESGGSRGPLITDAEALAMASFAVRGRAPTIDEQESVRAAGAEAFPAELGRTVRAWTLDPGFSRRAVDFAQQWLGVAHLTERLIRPGGRKDISGVLLDEFRHFVTEHFTGQDGSFERLFTATTTRFHPELEYIYEGRFVPPDRIDWDGDRRKGVLGTAGVLAAHANEEATDPVLRGMLVRLGLLCEPMPPPAPNADFTKVKVNDNMQTRERFETLSQAPACRSCHIVINPAGYLFESFDQYGRYREIERGRPVDSTGSIPPFFGQEPYRGVGAWSGITDLADWVAAAPEPRLCFAKGFANYLLSARVFDRTDSCALRRMAARFLSTGRLADLVEDIASSDVFRRRVRANGAAVARE